MTEKHLSTRFDSELSAICARVLEMGGLVESQTVQAMYALTHFSSETAAQVLEAEQRVNSMEVEIDLDLQRTIAMRQPAASDLRLLIAVSKASGNLERVGDEALDQIHRERSARTIRTELKRRARQLERFYVLVSSSLQITGPVDNSVGVESFIERRVQRSGRKATYTPRLGAETELVPSWVRFRAGTYLEPTRFESQGARARLHGTVGFDQKLFPWTVFGIFDEGTEWKLSAALDGARHYLSWGASVGIWR